MNNRTKLLVDSAAAIEESGLDPRSCSIWSTSTGLSLKTGMEINCPETFINSEDLDRIAKAATNISDEMRLLLLSLEKESPAYRWVSDTILTSVISFTRSLAVKALLLHRWHTAEIGAQSVVVGSTEFKSVTDLSIGIAWHDNAFALLLTSDSLKDEEIQLLKTTPVDPGLFHTLFNKVDLYDRVLNILRRSVSALLFKAWDKLGRPVIGLGSAGHLLVINETTTIEDCFVPLLRKGWRIEKLVSSPPSFRTRALSSAAKRTLKKVHKIIAKILQAPIGHESFAGAVSEITVQRLEKVLENYPSSVIHFETAVKTLCKKVRANETLVLSNGLFSAENRLFSAALRPAGIKTVCVDHGSAIGIPLFASQDLSTVYSFCDFFLNQNRKSSKLLNAAAPRPDFKAISVGAHRDLLRPRVGRIGRYLARKRLSIANGQRCAIYVSSLESNNVHLGYGAGRDLDLVDVQSGVLKAASAFEGTFVVKPYPVQRYPDPSFLTSAPLQGNIVRSPHGELLNIRFAADLIIVDATASTLGVVLGAGCPVIFIKNRRSRVASGAWDEMKKSLFCVDSDTDNWTQDLRVLLSQPLDELVDKWGQKEKSRSEFIDKRIAGTHQISSKAIPSALTQFLQS